MLEQPDSPIAPTTGTPTTHAKNRFGLINAPSPDPCSDPSSSWTITGLDVIRDTLESQYFVRTLGLAADTPADTITVAVAEAAAKDIARARLIATTDLKDFVVAKSGRNRCDTVAMSRANAYAPGKPARSPVHQSCFEEVPRGPVAVGAVLHCPARIIERGAVHCQRGRARLLARSRASSRAAAFAPIRCRASLMCTLRPKRLVQTIPLQSGSLRRDLDREVVGHQGERLTIGAPQAPDAHHFRLPVRLSSRATSSSGRPIR